MAKYVVKDFEDHIKLKAKSFARHPSDVDDFEQVGRIAAWTALKKDPNATKSFVHQAIRWRMSDLYSRELYKNPDELSADEHFGNMIWGDYTIET